MTTFERRINTEMQEAAKPKERFHGKRLTVSQNDESMMIAGIIAREIKSTGKFKEKLGDYSMAFARTQKFDVMRGEQIIREQFETLHGKTMNQMREELMEREANRKMTDKAFAAGEALVIGGLIKDGDEQSKSMPFYKAYDQQALKVAQKLNITESGAKSLMKEGFKEQAPDGQELYDWGKELEAKYHTPNVEAEKEQRAQMRGNGQERSQPRARM